MMKTTLSILLFTLGLYLTNFSQLVDEDFESYSSGTVITTIPSTLDNYQIDQNVGCSSDEQWIIKDVSSFSAVTCNFCSNNAATIYYGFCDQNSTLVTKSFQSAIGSINISFNYGFQYYSAGGDDSLVVELFNEDLGSVSNTLVSTNTTNYSGQYNGTISVNTNENYTLRFRYVGNFDYGATIDDILVEDGSCLDATFSQDCSNGVDYDITVDVTALGGDSTVSISDGSTTYYSNVSTGTFVINNIVNSSTIYVTNDIGCTTSESFSICDVCTNPSSPSDEPCNAPSLDLSQAYYGSTACAYTVSSGGTDLGPDAFCGAANNDSWLKFTAVADTVILDWTVIYDSVNGCDHGVQFAIFSGECNNQDGMVELACFNPSGDFQGTGTFEVGNVEIGSEYFIYIDGYAGDECDYSFTANVGVAITPPNDTCANATEISCGDLDISNNILATNIDAPASCNGLTPDVGVWYKYTGDGSTVTISTDNIATNYDTQLFLYSGDCDNLNCLDSDDNSGSGETSEIEFTSVDNLVYYIYVGGDNSSVNYLGQFGLSLNCNNCNSTTDSINTTICFGDSIEINGTFYSANNPTGTQILTAQNGCDSIVNISINELSEITSTINTSICFGENYLLNGQIYSSTGTYSQLLTNQDGCDSLIDLNLVVYNNDFQLAFQANPTTGDSPLSVIFDNQTPNITDYNFTWVFGDGTIEESNESSVTHVYQNEGMWNVTLIAENIYTGCSDTLTQNEFVSTAGNQCTHQAIINESGPINACMSDSISLTCNSSSNFIYQWLLNGFPISGANDSIYYPVESGDYVVVLIENNCSVYSNPVEVDFVSFSIPNITSSGEIEPCGDGDGDGDVTLSVPDLYESYLWSNGANSNSINVTVSGDYFVSITDSIGCIHSTPVYSINTSSVTTPEVCIVTVDSTSQHNLIVWEKENTQEIESYLIYRGKGTQQYYIQIGIVPYDSLSQFLDNSIDVNPNIDSYRYKISILDTCGTETNLSSYHETMHLSLNEGTSGEVNLTWDEYEGVPVNYYYILRDSTFSNNEWEVIDSVSSYNFMYTDYNVPSSGANYLIEVVPPNGCTATRLVDHNTTRSNRGTILGNTYVPVADFSASMTSIEQGSSINYFDQSTNSPTFWSWIFEGATPSTSNLENPTGIVYDSVGVFDVTLIVGNDFGTDFTVKNGYITVNNSTSAPNCEFFASSTQIASGTSINFLDQTQNNPSTWMWVFEGANPSFSTDQFPTNILYNNPGFYDVTLIATNANGTDTLIKPNYIIVSNGTDIKKNSSSNVKVYPNPTDNLINIHIDNYNGEVYTEVYDLIGNLIIKTTNNTLDFYNYANGIYFLKIAYDDKITKVKLIKE